LGKFRTGFAIVPLIFNNKGIKALCSLKVYSEVEWIMRELLRECTHRLVELADLTEGADNCEEWESMASHSSSLFKRTDQEEKFM
jgi:hypothetical protein